MPSTVFDSFYFKDRYGTAAMRALWDDRATLQRWLDVEAALSLVEAEVGLVPRTAARAIARQARLERLDLRKIKHAFDTTWNPVVPLVDALREVLPPSAARWVHWGATSKNIFDTGMALQIRDALELIRRDLDGMCAQLASLATRHRDTLMVGRTHGQHALPVTLGFKMAAWLDEMLRHRERLRMARPRILVGEFGGAVGTLASLGKKGLLVERKLMERLGLGVPTVPVKTAGDRVAEFALLLCMISGTVGKIAQSVYNLQQTEIDELTESPEGKVGSSAMPHKQNPVASGSIVLLGRLLRANAGPALDYMHSEWDDDHRQGETAWKFIPEVSLLAGAQLAMARRLLRTLVVKPENMLRNLELGGGMAASEGLMMALAGEIGRPRAHALVSELARDARRRRTSLRELATGHPEISRRLSPAALERCFDCREHLGLAPLFVDRVMARYRRAARAGPRGGRKGRADPRAG
jgi:adenylosuccinate lyase